MTNLAGKKPDWTLSIKHRDKADKAVIGVGWTQEDGSIALSLRPGATLDYYTQDDFIIRLFRETPTH